MNVHMDQALANGADVGFEGAILYTGVCACDCVCANASVNAWMRHLDFGCMRV